MMIMMQLRWPDSSYLKLGEVNSHIFREVLQLLTDFLVPAVFFLLALELLPLLNFVR